MGFQYAAWIFQDKKITMIHKLFSCKRLTFIFPILLLAINIFAQQVRVSVNIPPPYPIHLEDYFSFGNMTVITLTNQGNSTLNLKLITTVTDHQGIEGHVRDSWSPVLPVTLNPFEVKVLTSNLLQDHFNNLTKIIFPLQGITSTRSSAQKRSLKVCMKFV